MNDSRPTSNESHEYPVRQSLRMSKHAKIVFIDEDAEPINLNPKISIKKHGPKASKGSKALSRLLTSKPLGKRDGGPVIQLPSVD